MRIPEYQEIINKYNIDVPLVSFMPLTSIRSQKHIDQILDGSSLLITDAGTPSISIQAFNS